TGGESMADEIHLLPGRRRPDMREDHGASRLEAGLPLTDSQVLVQDPDQPSEVRVAPVATRALSLLDDHVDRRPRRCQVRHGTQLVELQVRVRGLYSLGSDEQAVFPHSLRETGEP